MFDWLSSKSSEAFKTRKRNWATLPSIPIARLALPVIVLIASSAGAMDFAALVNESPNAFKGAAVKNDAKSASGKVVSFALTDAKGQGQPLFKCSLPAKLAPAAPGKYRIVLRVKLEPADACSDYFKLAYGGAEQLFLGTDNPDPKNPDFRVWTLTYITPPAGNAQAKPELECSVEAHRFRKEPRFTALLAESISVERVGQSVSLTAARTNKLLYEPGEEISFSVTVKNWTAEPAHAELRATEFSDLGTSKMIFRQSVTIKAAAEEAATYTWNVGPEEYGREIRVELLDDGKKVIDAMSDYFNVADNVWKVAIRAASGPHMTHPDSVHCPYKTDEQWKKFLADFPAQLHAEHGNFMEWFAWSPDDAYFMTPMKDSWISGQGCYQHKRSRIIELNKVYRDNGVWPMTYAKSAASGPPSFEYMRKHPEFHLGRYQSQFDQQMVRDWNKQIPGQEKTIFYTWMSLVVDVTQPKLLDHCINEILDSAEMFGFKGARYDDHYTFWGKPYDALSTANMAKIFDIGKQRNPKFVFGFNYITSGVPWVWPPNPLPPEPCKTAAKEAGAVPDPAPVKWAKEPDYPGEFTTACGNGAFMMDEEARGAWSGTFSNYARLVNHEASVVRKLGGHFGPIPFDPAPVSAFNAYFPESLRAASRAHTYGRQPSATFAKFLTRYSDLIYGAALEPLTEPEAALKVDAVPGVWWHLFCYKYKQGGTLRAVVHLLSPPAKDAIQENTPGVAPRIHDVSVTYAGPEKPVRAWELSPFIDGFQRELPLAGNTVKPSDFHFWTMVVFDLENKP